ncbi:MULTISPECIES: MotA/TolQ/ExbB proton channel family protein [Methylobacillus]|uniref:Biopolymer transport protein ExbB n=1 Tax=Methylobacillus flagellatus (strain ATCC 51484 / DSM 6875 / VKM B-1610 / KT) TaxID=265072 RepID=Q1H2J8_METFK|nr:MotA/TolQ/ExbB proton channel family protein [Methylobacillus sp.]ABE49145.1 outer membrane transport energization protein ExbB [Methylobacillus flagellatus KT]ABE49289.1 outer membrane transport energization protein ExbB [Methylobacillus flagellatus KT]MPS49790.1 MotA/TolQ/ExbB proton channel family protein [Methylobacillus sp.]
MENAYEFNSLDFILDGGPVSILVAVVLVFMSVASWYLMVVKFYQALTIRSANREYSNSFWQASSIESALRHDSGETIVSRVANQAVDAAEHHQSHVGSNVEDACNKDEFIARAMRRQISAESERLDYGLTMLASVGSVAPFVGLFGTVWGIYHALASISQSGQATLDKVAGPVGEALIMTALGLAVAIPAVLAYNALVRRNRLILSEVEAFANDLHILLTTGAPLNPSSKTTAGVAAVRTGAKLKEVTA